jgi:thioredoxin-related protein
MNESGKQEARQGLSRWKRWIDGGGAVVFLAVLAFSFIAITRIALESSSPILHVQIFMMIGLMAVLFLVLIAALLNQRWKTGRFLPTPAEREERRNAYLDKAATGKPIGLKVGREAFQLIFFTTFCTIPLLIAFPYRSISRLTSLHVRSNFPLIMLLALAGISLGISSFFLFKIVRRKVKTGSFLDSPDESAKMRDRYTRPVPLWKRILIAVASLSIAVLATVIPMSNHRSHQTIVDLWVWVPAPFWFMAAFSIWQLFRPMIPLRTLSVATEAPRRSVKTTAILTVLVLLPLLSGSLGVRHILGEGHQVGKIFPASSQARADINAAIQSAAQNHKRILLNFGADWCEDCQVLDRYFHDATNRPIVESNFIVVDVDVDRDNTCKCNANKDLAQQYSVPLERGIPALAILNDKGELIYSQRGGEFEDMRHMKSSDLTAFLLRWKPDSQTASGQSLR